MTILENKSQFERFLELFNLNKSIIIPVFSDIYLHPSKNTISFIYFIIKSERFILSLNHNDCVNMSNDNLLLLQNSNQQKFVLNNKRFLHILKLKNAIDIETLQYIDGILPDKNIRQFNKNINPKFYNKFDRIPNINNAIPITNHIELLNNIAQYCITIYNTFKYNETHEYIKWDNFRSETFNNIESNGIKVDNSINKSRSEVNSIFYPEYELMTLTSRPSSFSSDMNFLSMSKESNIRNYFISRFGKNGSLLLFDFSAYHVQILAEILNKKINGYNDIFKILNNKEIEYSNEYDYIKQATFKIIYDNELLTAAQDLEFFNKVKLFNDELNKFYKQNNYILTTHGKKTNINKKINTNIQLNYFIQSYETERNTKLLDKLIKLTDNKKTKPILYIYDSILFDHNFDDNIIKEIKEILEEDGKFPVKTYIGETFGTLKKI